VDMYREHAALVRDAEGVTLRDVGASPALTVNGERVHGQRLLRDGDVVVLGTTSLKFHDPAEGYLRRLDAPGTPDELDTVVDLPPPRVPRAELVAAVIGALLALGAVIGLVYVCLQ